MRILIATVVLGAAVSCSSAPSGPEAGGTSTPSVRTSGKGESAHGGSGHPTGRPKHDSNSAESPGDGGAAAGEGDSGSDRGTATSGGSPSGGREGSGGRVYPAGGRYLYAQRGWEEFCQGTCDRRDLPNQQLLELSLRDANGQRAIVVAEAHQSDSRVTRSTMLFTESSALITNVNARVTYSGFTFEENYEPDPPVESLLFPLEVGKSWSGRWDADTSGDYAMKVLDRSPVDVSGRTIDAFVVNTVTHFRGEYRGSADITVWLDPTTRSVVKSTGDVRLEGDIGGYATHFEIDLTGGPGYR